MRHLDPWGLLPLAKDILLVSSALATGVFAWFKARRAQSWLSTEGRVADVTSNSLGGLYKPWIVKFTYSYTVNGEYFSGFHRIRCQRAKRAETIASTWKGRTVVVRYSPSKPETSTLLWSDQQGGQLEINGDQPAHFNGDPFRGDLSTTCPPFDTPPR